MGIDLISAVLEETSSLLNTVPSALKNRLYNNIACVEEHLQNMRNVNAFMLMNINRCMDYTKATNGLKLVPHIETAPLIETIALPSHVMSAMQGDKARIELRKVPDNICGHIITDKQWLEENILCLLSNAVKYSNKGLVTVSISLLERERGCLEIEDTPSEETCVSPSPSAKLRIKPNISPHIPPRSMSRMFSFVSQMTHGLSTRSICVDETYSRLSSAKSTESPPSSPFRKFGPFLRIEVEDTGIGLSDEVMQSLFSPFKQAQRLAGGTGLGLFSLSRRVEAIGGRYGVTKRQDGQQGSVFWFEIPYKPDTDYAHHMSQLTSARSGSSFCQQTSMRSLFSHAVAPVCLPSSKLITDATKTLLSVAIPTQKTGLNILLVDDTLNIQKMTRMLLQKQGHIVTVAENGVEALEVIAANYADLQAGSSPHMFDVVLMDFQMPIMDGLEATRRIRALEAQLREEHSNLNRNTTFHQLIIGLSANSDDETVQLARSEGMDDFMEKPFKAAVFNEIYQRMLATEGV